MMSLKSPRRWGIGISVALLFACALRAQDSELARAHALLKSGDARGALSILTELRRTLPNDANVCQALGLAYTQLGSLAEAEKAYREAVRLNPKFRAARKNLATVLWFLGRKDESARAFLALSSEMPGDPLPHLYLGLAAYERREYAHAKNEFERAGGLALENPEVLPAVLESALAVHDTVLPETVARRLASNPDAGLLLRMGGLFVQYRQYQPAIPLLEKAASLGQAAWRTLAEAYAGADRPRQAYAAYTRAIEAEPDSPEGYLALAEFASAHKNDDFAIETIGRGLERLPASAELLLEQGLLLAARGNREQAEASLSRVRQLKPAWDLPWLAGGVMQLEAGEMAGAAETFQRAIQVDAADWRGYYLYATALFKADAAAGREKAIAALRQAVQLNPAEARSHALLGQLLLAGGESEGAAREWRAALKSDPENTTALYQLGLLYRTQGKAEQSRRLLGDFQNVKAKKRAGEESVIQILKVERETTGNSGRARESAARP